MVVTLSDGIDHKDAPEFGVWLTRHNRAGRTGISVVKAAVLLELTACRAQITGLDEHILSKAPLHVEQILNRIWSTPVLLVAQNRRGIDLDRAAG